VRVYAGVDPVSKKRHYLVDTVPAGPSAARDAERVRTRLLNLFSRSADRGDDVIERFSGSVGSGHMPECDRLHLVFGDHGCLGVSSGDHKQLRTPAPPRSRDADVGQPHLAAPSQQTCRSRRGGALGSFCTSPQMTFDHGPQPDQLVLGKRIHDHLLPAAKPGRWSSGT
jgi:hypothetical protein